METSCQRNLWKDFVCYSKVNNLATTKQKALAPSYIGASAPILVLDSTLTLAKYINEDIKNHKAFFDWYHQEQPISSQAIKKICWKLDI